MTLTGMYARGICTATTHVAAPGFPRAPGPPHLFPARAGTPVRP